VYWLLSWVWQLICVDDQLSDVPRVINLKRGRRLLCVSKVPPAQRTRYRDEHADPIPVEMNSMWRRLSMWRWHSVWRWRSRRPRRPPLTSSGHSLCISLPPGYLILREWWRRHMTDAQAWFRKGHDAASPGRLAVGRRSGHAIIQSYRGRAGL